MTILVSRDAMHQFQAPEKSLGDISAEVAASLIAAAADIALVLDKDGVIRDLAFSGEELSHEGFKAWLGKPWIDTVTVESRPKVVEMLRDAKERSTPRLRQVNHPSGRGGTDIPVRYSAVEVGDEGRVVVLGRDLRAMAALQQRLVDAQQSMEREYSRLRQAETRYRLLFQIASEAVLIVDAGNTRVMETNPAANQMLGRLAKRIAGRAFPEVFEPEGAEAVQALLASVRTGGRGEEVRARLADDGPEFFVSASLFRQENASHFLVRLSPAGRNDAAESGPRGKSRFLKIVENLPDGFVVTGIDWEILTANSAFLDMVQLAAEDQARGESLERWLGRPGIDMGVLTASLREHGSVRRFATILRGEYGATEEVEISAVAVLNSDPPCFGFTIRNAERRIAPAEGRGPRELPRSVQQLTELVGRVSLKELVRETTDVIEKLCIEAALQLTGDNRASAAEMLGLSRQSLYAKLRRHGLGDLEPEND